MQQLQKNIDRVRSKCSLPLNSFKLLGVLTQPLGLYGTGLSGTRPVGDWICFVLDKSGLGSVGCWIGQVLDLLGTGCVRFWICLVLDVSGSGSVWCWICHALDLSEPSLPHAGFA